MALAVNTVNGHSSSNEMHHQLQPNKTKVMLVSAVNIAAKAVYPSFITNKMKHTSFKSRCFVQVAKHLKEDWFIVLH